MISTGITGAARHGTTPYSASNARVKTLLPAAPPRARMASRARAHVLRVRRIADHFQREIRFHAGADVELAVMEKRPAAMRALDAAQIGADLCLKLARRPLRRDSAAAAHIRPEWWRRLRARTPSARPGAARSAALRSPRRCAASSAIRGPRRQTALMSVDVGFTVIVLDCPSCFSHRSRRLVARSDRTFDRRGQAGCRPIAGKHEIVPGRPQRRTLAVLAPAMRRKWLAVP